MPRTGIAAGLSALVSLSLAILVMLQLAMPPDMPAKQSVVREPDAPAPPARQLSGILLPPPPPMPAPAAPAVPAVMPAETAPEEQVEDQAETEPDLEMSTSRADELPASAPVRTPDELVPEAVSHQPEPEQSAAPVREQSPVIDEPAAPAPRERAVARAAPRHEPPAQQDSVAVVSQAVAGQGRALLRILEHGSGPSVEIAWPNDPAVQSELYRELAGCYGMRLALMDRGGLLYGAAQAPGESWPINLDRYSGFVRQPTGGLAPDERREAARIRAHHRGLPGHVAVRIFPRGVDALLLGGLRQLVGRDYPSLGSIRAEYQIQGGALRIGKLIVDGRPLAGRIDLSRARRRC